MEPSKRVPMTKFKIRSCSVLGTKHVTVQNIQNIQYVAVAMAQRMQQYTAYNIRMKQQYPWQKTCGSIQLAIYIWSTSGHGTNMHWYTAYNMWGSSVLDTNSSVCGSIHMVYNTYIKLQSPWHKARVATLGTTQVAVHSIQYMKQQCCWQNIAVSIA